MSYDEEEEWQLSEDAEDTDESDEETRNGRSITPLVKPESEEPLAERTTSNGFVVSLQPPTGPSINIKHVPVDIVLVIDVSGSMQVSAPMPTESGPEDTGLSILDLTKHAARAVIGTLEEGDRVGIIAFSTTAKARGLISGNGIIVTGEDSKKSTMERVDRLVPKVSTNLWHGLKEGLKLFENASYSGNVQAMYVLTDGVPNHMCPSQGYVPKLKPILKSMKTAERVPPAIHTFGFGYSLRSGLLQSIAEIGGGNYAFIPDAGMIGTVFIHAVANLYCTFATNASLTIKLSGQFKPKLEDATSTATSETSSEGHLVVQLGNIRYGQPRDVVVEVPVLDADYTGTGKLSLQYNTGGRVSEVFVDIPNSVLKPLPQTSSPYLQAQTRRASLCRFLNSIFPINSDGEHEALPTNACTFYDLKTSLADTIRDFARTASTNSFCAAMLRDLTGNNPDGQVEKALADETAYYRWGRHFLPSLLSAHTHQLCNSFKDPGPLQYGTQSPLFISNRELLDEQFDNMPPPKPSAVDADGYVWDALARAPRPAPSSNPNFRMRAYNSRVTPCFAGHCQVKMADGSLLPVKELRKGMKVHVPMHALNIGGVNQMVRAVLETKLEVVELVKYKGLDITGFHPVMVGGRWVFPRDLPEGEREVVVRENISVYSILLEQGAAPELVESEKSRHLESARGKMECGIGGNTVVVEDTVVVTLGHGLVGEVQENDVRPHPFLGNYDKVWESMQELPFSGDEEGGVRTCGGLRRDGETGMICGFE
ncbi:hypothetical protein K402DRAFT_446363 [Aulographum hederae CBS 113979]|uniref:VWFA domain-containing protein n=1 Tax=Aulographum hederae CBS 113979 TaxID=1176131 RepID=A0A6G1H1C9_9PEZI|nr:hypothetical protein K402DRAFT_446363 [Aulographum hederae CBS 113979]